jgi:hypothetical protein
LPERLFFHASPGLVELSEADHERKAVRSGNVGIRVRIFARSVYRAPLDRERFELPTPELVSRTGATADPEGTTEERVLSVWDLVWDF